MSTESVVIKTELHPTIHQRVVELSESTGVGRAKIYAYAIAYATGHYDFFDIVAAIGRGTIFNNPICTPKKLNHKE